MKYTPSISEKLLKIKQENIAKQKAPHVDKLDPRWSDVPHEGLTYAREDGADNVYIVPEGYSFDEFQYGIDIHNSKSPFSYYGMRQINETNDRSFIEMLMDASQKASQQSTHIADSFIDAATIAPKVLAKAITDTSINIAKGMSYSLLATFPKTLTAISDVYDWVDANIPDYMHFEKSDKKMAIALDYRHPQTSSFANWATNVLAKTEEIARQSAISPQDNQNAFYRFGAGLGNVGLFLAMSSVGGGAMVPLVLFGTAYEDTKQQLMAAGYDEEFSRQASLMQGVGQAAIGTYGIKLMGKYLLGNRFVKEVLTASGVSVAATGYSQGVMNVFGVDCPVDNLADILASGLEGAAIGLTFGTGSAYIHQFRYPQSKQIAQNIMNNPPMAEGIKNEIAAMLDNQYKALDYHAPQIVNLLKNVKSFSGLDQYKKDLELTLRNSNIYKNDTEISLQAEMIRGALNNIRKDLGVSPRTFVNLTITTSKEFQQLQKQAVEGELFQEGARGEFRVKKNLNDIIAEIKLNPNADPTTINHELMHYVYSIYKYAAENGIKKAQERLQSIQKDIPKEHIGNDDYVSEAIAKEFEMYLKEGVSPNVDVAAFFEVARRTFSQIYGDEKVSTGKFKDFFDDILGGYDEHEQEVTIESAKITPEKIMQIFLDLHNNGKAHNEEEEVLRSICMLAKKDKSSQELLLAAGVNPLEALFLIQKARMQKVQNARKLLKKELSYKKFLEYKQEYAKEGYELEKLNEETFKKVSRETKSRIEKIQAEKDYFKKIRELESGVKEAISNLEKAQVSAKDVKDYEKQSSFARKMLIDFIKASNLEVKDRGKFLDLVNKIKNPQDFDYVFSQAKQSIAKFVENKEINQIRNKITNFYLDPARIAPRQQKGAVPKGKFESAQMQDFMNELSYIWNKLKGDDAILRYEDSLEKIQEGQDVDPVELLLLQARSQGYKMPLDMWKRLDKELERMLAQGRSTSMLEREVTAKHKKELIDFVKANIKTPAIDQKFTLSKLGSGQVFHNFNTLTTTFFNKDCADFFNAKWNSAARNLEKRKLQTWERTEPLLNKIWDTKSVWSYNKEVDRLNEVFKINRQVDGLEEKYTRGQIIDLYMQMQTPETAMFIRDMENGNKLGSGDIDQLLSHLEEKDYKVAEMLFENYEVLYQQQDQYFREKFKTSLPRISGRYVPRETAQNTLDKKDGLRNMFSMGWTKKRAAGVHKIAFRDCLNRFDRHQDEINQFLALDDLNRTLQSVFRTPSIQNEIKERFGSKLFDAWTDIVALGSRSTPSGDIGDTLRGAFQSAKIGLAPIQFLKQMVSQTAVLEAIPISDAVSGFADFYLNLHSASSSLLENSYMLKARYKRNAFNRDVESLFQKSSALGKKVSEILIFFSKWGDLSAIMPGMHSIIKTKLKNGFSYEESMLAAENWATTTQSTQDNMHRTLLSRGGMFGKLFTMFQSQNTGILQRQYVALKELQEGAITVSEFAQKTAGLQAAFMLFTMVSMGGIYNWQDFKDFGKDVLLQNAVGFNPTIKGLFQILLGQYGFAMPFTQDFKNLIQSYNKMLKSTDYDVAKLIAYMSEILFAIAPTPLKGLPALRLYNEGNGLFKIINADNPAEVVTGVMQSIGYGKKATSRVSELDLL